jgi:xanthine dehydrogenase molybdopterin-binding subunit B
VVAHELGMPLERVRVHATDTSKVANTSATAASTGSDLNGKAAQARAPAPCASAWQPLPQRKWGGAPDAVRFADGHGGAERPVPALRRAGATRPTSPACSCGATASTPRPA